MSRARRALLVTGVVSVLVTAALGAALLRHRNVAEIEPGVLYRSGQLPRDELSQLIDAHGIATIVNLRGRYADADWYRAEAALARENGIRLFDIGLSSRRIPHRSELLELLDAFRDARTPILVHCLRGADRAGLVTAVFLMENLGRSREEALDMLQLRYRHLAFHRPAMRYFVERYRGADWARASYHPCRSDWDHYPRDRYCAEDGTPLR